MLMAVVSMVAQAEIAQYLQNRDPQSVPLLAWSVRLVMCISHSEFISQSAWGLTIW